MKSLFIVAMVAILLNFSSRATAAPAPAEEYHVKVSLVSDVVQIRAGKPFTIGVLFEPDPGWHLYYAFPGEGGLPTLVKFTLPDGFTVTPDPYPVPKRIQDGKEVGYGYDTPVILSATVTPPNDLRIGTEFPVAASANWLLCKNACEQGKTSVSTTLKVSDHSNPAHVDAFTRNGPNVAPKAHRPADIAGVQATLDAKTHVLTYVIHWKDPGNGVQIFPGSDDATITSVQVKAIPKDAAPADKEFTTVTCKITLNADTKPTGNSMPILLAYRDSSGHVKGWETTIPMK